MVSTDKTLSNLSAWISLAALAGLVVIPLFFTHHDAPPAPPAPRTKPPPAVNAPAPPSPSPSAQVPAAGAPKAEPGVIAPPPNAPATNAPTANAPGAPTPAPPPETWSDAEQVAGLRDCLRLLAPLAVEVDLDTPMRHGQCGTPAPLALRSVGEGEKVVFEPAPR